MPKPKKSMGGTKQPSLNCCCCNPFTCCCGCLLNCICTCICQIILTILIVVGIVAFVLYLVFQPNTVNFHATDASLTEFAIDGNHTLRYDLAVNLTIRNPNRRIGIYYDRIEARAFYQGQKFHSVVLPPFYQGRKSTRNVTAVFKGQQHLLPLGNKEMSKYNRDGEDGAYNIDVKLYLRTRMKFWFVKSSMVKPKINCNLRVPLRSNGTVGLCLLRAIFASSENHTNASSKNHRNAHTQRESKTQGDSEKTIPFRRSNNLTTFANPFQ
ncbi:late embryogenesis abundant protein [Striga asiatica]|uniref:Late embryogenesis abundant protein n=1 Tax=Striga asiatica TaxID=4170 RepID=A0A5A7QKZ1_STRAF|nr:late embryogenesis abundant protein [Striga asiatica]